jgi:hypothetical protein
VIDHHREHVEEIPVVASGGHGGGDQELASNFIDVMRGREPSRCPLDAGLLSAAMCLCAREAANDGMTRRIPRFDGSATADQPRRRGAPEIEPVNRRPS